MTAPERRSGGAPRTGGARRRARAVAVALGIALPAALPAACGAGADGAHPAPRGGGRAAEEEVGDAGSLRAVRYPAGPAPVSVLVADLNRDGHDDVAVSGEGGVRVMSGDGSGRLSPGRPVAAGPSPQGLTAGDFDEDGWPDLAVANHERARATVLFGGRGGFGARRLRIPVETDPHAHEVRAADVDGDGHLDLLVDDRGGALFRVHRGSGDGTFVPGDPIPVGGDPYLRIVVADLDGDGDLDLATPNPRAVAVHFSNGEGGFVPGARLRSDGVRPFGLAVGDVDGDGAPDLLAVDAGEGGAAGRFALWLGSGPGKWTPAAGSPYPAPPGPGEAVLADVDGDGLDDAVVTGYAGDGLALLPGARRGEPPIRISLAESPWGVAAGDLDGDGRHEVVVALHGSDEVAVLFHRPDG